MHLEEQKQECYRKKDLILGFMSYRSCAMISKHTSFSEQRTNFTGIQRIGGYGKNTLFDDINKIQ